MGTAGLLHPELQLRLVGIEPHSSRSIRTANASLTDLQPLIAIQVLGLDQPKGRAGFGEGCPHR